MILGPFAAIFRRQLVRRLACAACAVLAGLGSGLVQAQERVAVLLSDGGGVYREFVDALQRSLDEQGGARASSIVELSSLPERADEAPLAGAGVLVAVGVRAMRAAAERNDLPPTLAVLVPRTSYERVVAESARRRSRAQFSAVYLDQPLSRQIGLVRALIRDKPRVGVLFGPDSSFFLPRLRAEEARGRIELVGEKLLSELDLIPALSRVLGDADLLLALPDSVVFTRESARPILLTAYRYRKPMFGFSQAYVNSGALAAVFSTPQQIARQSAEILRATMQRRVPLPPAAYPRYFSVSVNRSVARALAIEAPADEALQSLLAEETDAD